MLLNLPLSWQRALSGLKLYYCTAQRNERAQVSQDPVYLPDWLVRARMRNSAPLEVVFSRLTMTFV